MRLNRMKNPQSKYLFIAVAFIVLISGCAQFNISKNKVKNKAQGIQIESTGPVFQVSTITDLNAGNFDGILKIDELLKYGDTGIGVLDGFNGELIILDSIPYQAKSDGTVVRLSNVATTPFAIIGPLNTNGKTVLNNVSDINSFEANIENKYINSNKKIAYLLKIDGAFNNLVIRSVSKQNKPYKTLEETIEASQKTFNYSSIIGTIIGVWTPSSINGVLDPGFHFSLISDDRKGWTSY